MFSQEQQGGCAHIFLFHAMLNMSVNISPNRETGPDGQAVSHQNRRSPMNSRALLKCFLILGLAAAILCSVLSVLAQQSPAPKPGAHKVIAYYFHTNTRCSTCIKIEAYSKEAIEQGFPEELKKGTLEMRIVNYENPENRHFMQDYKLVSKSLVLVNMVDEKQTEWTNLKVVWQLTGRKDAFLNYVRKEVRGYLAKS
jgi:hypothetical protein